MFPDDAVSGLQHLRVCGLQLQRMTFGQCVGRNLGGAKRGCFWVTQVRLLPKLAQIITPCLHKQRSKNLSSSCCLQGPALAGNWSWEPETGMEPRPTSQTVEEQGWAVLTALSCHGSHSPCSSRFVSLLRSPWWHSRKWVPAGLHFLSWG